MTLAIDKQALSKTLIKTAWLSVLLGLGMEILLLAAAAYFKNIPSTQAIIAETVQKISWSTLVCAGVAIGTAATRMRPTAMGLAGFIVAPVAFYVAKIAHKSVSQALAIAGQVVASGPSPFLLAGIKALEYALLGYLIGQLGKKTAVGLKGHILAGTGIGSVFGGSIVYLMVTMAKDPIPLAGIVTRGINEMIFPIGCSLVLYAAQRLGSQHDIERPEVDTPEPEASIEK